MIEKLKNEIIYERGIDPKNPMGYVLNAIGSRPPSNELLSEKINEVIDFLNKNA